MVRDTIWGRPNQRNVGLAKLASVVHKTASTAQDAVGYPGCGCSSVVEHDLAKVGVEGSNPFARSKISHKIRYL
jgi:hypothetical protein